jgi:Ser/Thr protein kinase RdoA (MazF antagonist)
MSLQTLAQEALSYFPEATAQSTEMLGGQGGASGARIWRAMGYNGPLCLRAWPLATSSDHLSFVHLLMRRASILKFVPRIYQTRQGDSWIRFASRLWDLTSWAPGSADFAGRPSTRRLENACATLAQLHNTWQTASENPRPCAAIKRRLERAQVWSRFVESGWQPPDHGYPCAALHAQIVRAWKLLPPLMERLPGRLEAVAEMHVRPQPCHGDLWHDNVLFQGELVSGIVDYAAITVDHVAVDLGRLLGSLVPDDQPMMEAGLAAYMAIRPLSAADRRLVQLLDETGAVISAANWLIWPLWEGVKLDNPEGAAQRLTFLLNRIERWST